MIGTLGLLAQGVRDLTQVGPWPLLGGIALVVVLAVVAVLLAKRYVKVGPNEALIVYGWGKTVRDAATGRSRRAFHIVRGGGKFVIPVIHTAEVLSLEIMTIDVKTPEVQSISGLPVIVDGVAQVKIKSDDVSIETAAEMFLGRSRQELMSVAHQTLEGHLRAIIGRMSVEDLFREREKFAQGVQTVSATDFLHMGLEVVSFVIREIRDNLGYLESLARQPSAVIRSQADIVQAEAQRDATMKSAEARRQGEEARFAAEAEVARAERDYQVKQAEYQAAVNSRKAEADLAYDLQKFKTMQIVKVEEVNVDAREKEALIIVQRLEIERKERELDATIRKPAEADRYRVQTQADAERYRIEAEATARGNAEKAVGLGQAEATKARGLAEAEVRRAQGLAEAEVIRAKGEAEAEAMRRKAEAWRAYNEAAVAQMYIERLPDIARAVAEPMSRIERVVLISNGDSAMGASKVTRDVLDIVAQLPPVLEASTGLNLKDLLAALPKLGQKSKSEGGRA